MRIGLIDVDGHNYPNIPLMKISAYHKQKGDSVEWYNPLFSGHMDKVYMSKVFSFTPDYEYCIDADVIVKGGTGYAISLVDGKEIYDKSKDPPLDPEIEHIYPDYSIYPEQTKDTAYGFLTRGCPRGCDFCHVAPKEGKCSHMVAHISEFWRGQKNIILCDPNILACPNHISLLEELAETGSRVEFNQGLDIRLLTPQNLDVLKQIKLVKVHFAYDRIQDRKIIEPRLIKYKEVMHPGKHSVRVYCLVNFDTTLEDDLHRIYFMRDLVCYQPYIMIYNKQNCPKIYRHLQRWVNNNILFWSVPRFEDYLNTINYSASELKGDTP